MILKKVRAIPVFNKLIRNALLSVMRSILFLQKRWKISGCLNLSFEGVGFKYYSRADDSIADMLYYGNNYIEYASIETFLKVARLSKVILDIGANTGLYSVIGAKSNADATFYSFEPNPANFKRLRQNIQLNDIHNVTTLQQAVGNTNLDIQFFVPKTGEIIDTSSALRDFSESTYDGKISWINITVGQTTLDNFVEMNSISHIDLMKVDVEGYELMVFEGGQKIIEKFKPVIICEIFLNDEKKIYFHQFTKRHGYIAYMILEDGLVRMDEELIQNEIGLNYLFSTVRTENVFTPFRELHQLINVRD